jgi:hypothetical protein
MKYPPEMETQEYDSYDPLNSYVGVLESGDPFGASSTTLSLELRRVEQRTARPRLPGSQVSLLAKTT